MINASAQPIFIYPDQLLKETWPSWVESVLSEQPDIQFHDARGFQDLTNSTDSTGRTRAGECYRLGLILQRVIKERSRSDASGMPKGWQYLCEGKNVISRTGYLSYAIGKALSSNNNLVDVEESLNVLHLIFALSQGIEYNTGYISTALVYAWTIEEFRKHIGESQFNSAYEDYSRFIAAAVFRTLDSPEHKGLFINEYIGSLDINSLFIQKSSDQSFQNVTPELLREKVSGLPSNLPNVNEIPSAKAALFWASLNRGIYQKAVLVGYDLIKTLILYDQEHCRKHATSVLTPAIHIPMQEDHLLLENLDSIFKNNPSISPLWSSLMEKLANGVYSALAYVENSVGSVRAPAKFYLHGVSTISSQEDHLTVELLKATVPIEPKIGSTIVFNNKEFYLRDLSVSDTHFILTLEAS